MKKMQVLIVFVVLCFFLSSRSLMDFNNIFFSGRCLMTGTDKKVMAGELNPGADSGPRRNRSRLRILSSRNLIFPGGVVYVCGDLVSRNQKHRSVQPRWSLEPATAGLSIDAQGRITADVKLTVKADMTVKVVATYRDRRAEKILKIVGEDPLPGKHRVHYFRHDGNFDGWNLWVWNRGQEGRQVSFEERTDFGAMGAVQGQFAIVRYLDWFAKETGDLALSGREDTYIVEGDHRVFYSFADAVKAGRPRIWGAVMDDTNRVVARLPVDPGPQSRFHLFMNQQLLCSAKARGHELVFDITRPYEFDPSALFYIRASRVYHDSPVFLRGVLDQFYYSGNDMGVTYDDQKIHLRLWAPGAGSVDVILPEDDKADLENAPRIPLRRAEDRSGTWHGSLDRKTHYGSFYIYQLQFHTGTPFARTTRGVDPYARALSVNGKLGALIDVVEDPRVNPPGWDPSNRPPFGDPCDAVIYELHVRDFSVDENSGIEEKLRGRYGAFTRTGTHIPGNPDISTGIDHLMELGITHLHLLPVYDFATVDETKIHDPEAAGYNWGYDPQNYNAPEGSYSTDPWDPPIRIRQFKEMVQALHDNDIRVVMDVVYNHTFDTGVFEPFARGYYYRTDSRGRFTNGSGCGNEVATERPMVRKFIVDSVVHWATTYGLDGFRFDLMGIIDIETMKQVTRELHRIDPTILIYGEPWGGGATSLAGHKQIYKGSQKNSGFAVFNDSFRNSLRGDNSIPHPSRAYVTGSYDNSDSIRRGVAGSIDEFTDHPGETINYVACHDNYVIWDQVISALGHSFPHPYNPNRSDGLKSQGPVFEDRVRRVLLAYGIVMTSQGIPFISAGDEMLRTKFGDHNSYRSPDSINRIRWQDKADQLRVFEYFKGLVALRRSHGAFRMRSSEQVRKHLRWIDSPPGVVAFRLEDHANGDEWKNIIVIYNPRDQVAEMDIPGGPWTVVVNDRQAGVEPVGEGYSIFDRRIIVAPVSIMVLHDSP